MGTRKLLALLVWCAASRLVLGDLSIAPHLFAPLTLQRPCLCVRAEHRALALDITPVRSLRSRSAHVAAWLVQQPAGQNTDGVEGAPSDLSACGASPATAVNAPLPDQAASCISCQRPVSAANSSLYGRNTCKRKCSSCTPSYRGIMNLISGERASDAGTPSKREKQS